MPVDFNSLVLAPAMDAFAVVVAVQPIKSQPDVASYDARGVWDVNYREMMLEDGAPLATKVYTLGIRLSEFAVVPVQGDRVVIEGHLYNIDKFDPDGQGGATLTLKARTTPRLEGSTP